jgi:hypothetical protein
MPRVPGACHGSKVRWGSYEVHSLPASSYLYLTTAAPVRRALRTSQSPYLGGGVLLPGDPEPIGPGLSGFREHPF